MSHLYDLLPCPFCGHNPTMEHWHGGGPQKRAISCENDDCAAAPMVTGSTARKAAEKWNQRDSQVRAPNGDPSTIIPPPAAHKQRPRSAP